MVFPTTREMALTVADFQRIKNRVLERMGQRAAAARGRLWLGAYRTAARQAELNFGPGTAVREVGMAPPIHLTEADLLMSGDPARATWDPRKTEYT